MCSKTDYLFRYELTQDNVNIPPYFLENIVIRRLRQDFRYNPARQEKSWSESGKMKKIINNDEEREVSVNLTLGLIFRIEIESLELLKDALKNIPNCTVVYQKTSGGNLRIVEG